jgi:L-threonine kinase
MNTQRFNHHSELQNPLSDPIGTAIVRAPGVCGELVQGMINDHNFLVTCPIDFFSRVEVNIYASGTDIIAPANCRKSSLAVEATLQSLGYANLSAVLKIYNPIPRGKGMGSSSADVIASIAATGLSLGCNLSPQDIANIAVSIEPSDGVMFPGIALFDYKKGYISEELGNPPPMEIVALDFGGTVNTVQFNQVDRSQLWKSIQSETDKALEFIREGINKGIPSLIGEGATISAVASQSLLENMHLKDVLDFSSTVGGAGVCLGHSGTIIGILLDARQKKGKSVFNQARRTFQKASEIYHFRMLGGGIRTRL